MGSAFVTVFVPYVAPLCPAGHLPHLGGDWLAPLLVLILQRGRLAKAETTADLPTCGGDVRQDRGARDKAPSSLMSGNRNFGEFAGWLRLTA